MRRGLIILFVFIFLFIFVFGYFYISNNYIRDFDDYHNNPDCEMKRLDDGFTQLPNCAKYKFKNPLYSFGVLDG